MKKVLAILLSLLLLPSHSYAGKWHTNMKKQEKKDFGRYVLKAQSKNKMVFNNRTLQIKMVFINFLIKLKIIWVLLSKELNLI
jgi:hypothetical protein